MNAPVVIRLRAHLATALARNIEHTVSARAQRDPAFARALFDEALTLLRTGELAAARALLRHLRRR